MFLEIAGTPQGSIVMTDADWAGDVKDRRSYSGIAVRVKGSVENTWYPVYASSKKQNMVCLSSGESELMALVGGAFEGIATRDHWSKMCNCSTGTTVLCTDSAAALGLVKRKGASRRTNCNKKERSEQNKKCELTSNSIRIRVITRTLKDR